MPFILSVIDIIQIIYLTQKRDDPYEDNQDGSHLENAFRTILVTGIKETTTQDAVTMFFQNKRRSRGGELCPGEEGYKRLSYTVARLTFLSSKGIITIYFSILLVYLRSPSVYVQSLCVPLLLIFSAVPTLLCLDVQNVLKRSNEIPLKLDGKILNVSIGLKSNSPEYFPDKIQQILPQTHSGEHRVEPPVMDYIMNLHDIETEFGFKTIKYDKTNSTFHFTNDFRDVQEADEFKEKLRGFFNSFFKEDVKIPKGIFQKLKETIENERDKFGQVKVDFVGLRVSLLEKRKMSLYKNEELKK